MTDWLDGYLARRWEQGTPFGAFLDPVADKLIVVTALVLLCWYRFRERLGRMGFYLLFALLIGIGGKQRHISGSRVEPSRRG